MGTLAPKLPLDPSPQTPAAVRARLAIWRERLVEAKDGRTNAVLTPAEIRSQLDRLLDALLELHPTLGPCALVEGETICRGCGREPDLLQPGEVA